MQTTALAQPEQQIATDERKTVELCGDQKDGRRCIRPHGHEGHHESHTATDVHSWK